MLELLELGMFKMALTFIGSYYEFTFYYGTIISFLTGAVLPIAYFDKPERTENDSIIRRLFVAISILLIPLGVLSNFTVPWLVKSIQSFKVEATNPVHYPFDQFFYIPLFVLGIALHVVVRRYLSPRFNEMKIKATKKTKLMRDERTDVRTIKEFLPDSINYNPEDYIDLTKGVFVGLDVNHEPLYIPLELIQKQHLDAIGTTGAGKGVAVGLVLYQLILAGEGTFVLDPKDDEWAPHLMKYACEKAGKPFHLINLNDASPQLDLLAGASRQQIEELLVAGFSLAEKGDLADFYRIDDRKASRKAPEEASSDERRTLKKLFNTQYVQGLQETVKAFYGKLEEMSLVDSINAEGGLNLKDVFDNGGCCYIVGSIRNAKVLIAQKMILLRLYQLAESRDRVNGKPRPIAIFLDELKYHISRAVMEGLGAIRDKGVHILMAHQSVADLRDCPADLNGDAVVGSVVENAKLKIVYKIQDPETAQWVADMSGTILVDDETRKIETSKTLTEKMEGDKTVRLAERNYVDSNMLMNLPDKVSYVFTSFEIARSSVIQPVKVSKQPLAIYSMSEAEEPELDEELIEDTPHEEAEEESMSRTDTHEEELENPDEELDLDSFVVGANQEEVTESVEDEAEDEAFTEEEELALLAELEEQVEGLE